MPAIASTLHGGGDGFWLGSRASGGTRALLMAAAGIAAMAIGLAVGSRVPDQQEPVDELRTPGSWAAPRAVFLALCYALIDVKGWTGGARPFVVLGVNAIALFVLSGLMTSCSAATR